MKELYSEPWIYNLIQDDSGQLFLQALCNQSAFYYFVTFKLRPAEAAALFSKRSGEVTQKGKKLLKKLADGCQASPTTFMAGRETA